MTQFARAYWRLDNWLGIEFLGTITWLLRIWRSIWLPINNPAGKHWAHAQPSPVRVPELLSMLALERAAPASSFGFDVAHDGTATVLTAIEPIEIDRSNLTGTDLARARFQTLLSAMDVAKSAPARQSPVAMTRHVQAARQSTAREAAPPRLPVRPVGAHRLAWRRDEPDVMATRNTFVTELVAQRRAEAIAVECLERSPGYRLRMGT